MQKTYIFIIKIKLSSGERKEVGHAVNLIHVYIFYFTFFLINS